MIDIKKFLIKNKVNHQNIGGKEFIVDEYITEMLSPNKIFEEAATGNIACQNFISRRSDFDYNFKYKLFYGKVNGLGYILSEDEIEKVIL